MTTRRGSKRPKRKTGKVDIIASTFPHLPDITAKPPAERERASGNGLRVSADAMEFWVSYFNLHAVVPLWMTGARYVHTDGKGKHHGLGQHNDDKPATTDAEAGLETGVRGAESQAARAKRRAFLASRIVRDAGESEHDPVD